MSPKRRVQSEDQKEIRRRMKKAEAEAGGEVYDPDENSEEDSTVSEDIDESTNYRRAGTGSIVNPVDQLDGGIEASGDHGEYYNEGQETSGSGGKTKKGQPPPRRTTLGEPVTVGQEPSFISRMMVFIEGLSLSRDYTFDSETNPAKRPPPRFAGLLFVSDQPSAKFSHKHVTLTRNYARREQASRQIGSATGAGGIVLSQSQEDLEYHGRSIVRVPILFFAREREFVDESNLDFFYTTPSLLGLRMAQDASSNTDSRTRVKKQQLLVETLSRGTGYGRLGVKGLFRVEIEGIGGGVGTGRGAGPKGKARVKPVGQIPGVRQSSTSRMSDRPGEFYGGSAYNLTGALDNGMSFTEGSRKSFGNQFENLRPSLQEAADDEYPQGEEPSIELALGGRYDIFSALNSNDIVYIPENPQCQIRLSVAVQRKDIFNSQQNRERDDLGYLRNQNSKLEAEKKATRPGGVLDLDQGRLHLQSCPFPLYSIIRNTSARIPLFKRDDFEGAAAVSLCV